MKRIKFVNRIAVFAMLALASSSCKSSNVASTPPPSQTKALASCSLVAGQIWAKATLYRDSACQQPFAKIVSASRETVTIQLDSGEVETKNREAFKKQAYVMTNDPAIP